MRQRNCPFGRRSPGQVEGIAVNKTSPVAVPCARGVDDCGDRNGSDMNGGFDHSPLDEGAILPQGRDGHGNEGVDL